MKIVVLTLSLFMFYKTLAYGIFEYKEKNKFGAIVIYILAVITLIAPNVLIYFR